MSTIGVFHTTFGMLALVFGAIVLLVRKGTKSHRRLGWAYVLSMLGMLFTSFLIYRLFGHFGPFHILSVISFITLLIGFLPAWTRRPRQSWVDRHYFYMSYSYGGLVAATAAEIAVRVPNSPFGTSAFVSSALIFVATTAIVRAKRKSIVSAFQEKEEVS